MKLISKEGCVIKPINEEQLQTRLSSGSKIRLKAFRNQLLADRDVRNFDSDLDTEVQKYLNPWFVKEYYETKEYLKELRSSSNGKLFSQGVKESAHLMMGVEKFEMPNHPSFRWNRNYQDAKAEMLEKASKLKLKQLEYVDDESMIQALPKDDTHSGWTYILTGKRKKRENLDNIYARYVVEEQAARNCGSFNKPILPGVRTQASGAFNDVGERTGDCKHKTRLIMMIDLMMIFAELKFAKPYQQAIAKECWYAGGKDTRDVSTIITTMRSRNRSWISLDYSSYDQSLSDWLIRDAFDILKAAFVKVDEELFQIVVDDFINKNIIMWDGVHAVKKGVPSGSMFTQIIDSIANVLMITTYLRSIHVRGEMIVMGDDNLLYTWSDVDKDLLASYLNKNFGTKVNPDKTLFGPRSQDPTFLSREWKAHGQYREPHVVVSKMLYPERWRNYRDGKVDAKLVLFAYILTYTVSMHHVIDVGRFLKDNPHLNRAYVFNSVDSRYLPGALAFIRDYTRFKDSA